MNIIYLYSNLLYFSFFRRCGISKRVHGIIILQLSFFFLLFFHYQSHPFIHPFAYSSTLSTRYSTVIYSQTCRLLHTPLAILYMYISLSLSYIHLGLGVIRFRFKTPNESKAALIRHVRERRGGAKKEKKAWLMLILNI